MRGYRSLLLAVAAMSGWLLVHGGLAGELRVSPNSVVFDRPETSQQLLITEVLPDGRLRDVTRESVIEIVPAGSAMADSTGLLRPLTEGRAEAIVRRDGSLARIPIEIRGLKTPPPVSFGYDIIPILTKSRCNS